MRERIGWVGLQKQNAWARNENQVGVFPEEINRQEENLELSFVKYFFWALKVGRIGFAHYEGKMCFFNFL